MKKSQIYSSVALIIIVICILSSCNGNTSTVQDITTSVQAIQAVTTESYLETESRTVESKKSFETSPNDDEIYDAWANALTDEAIDYWGRIWQIERRDMCCSPVTGCGFFWDYDNNGDLELIHTIVDSHSHAVSFVFDIDDNGNLVYINSHVGLEGYYEINGIKQLTGIESRGKGYVYIYDFESNRSKSIHNTTIDKSVAMSASSGNADLARYNAGTEYLQKYTPICKINKLVDSEKSDSTIKVELYQIITDIIEGNEGWQESYREKLLAALKCTIDSDKG